MLSHLPVRGLSSALSIRIVRNHRSPILRPSCLVTDCSPYTLLIDESLFLYQSHNEKSAGKGPARRDNKSDLMSILTINLLLSTLVFWVAARIYLLPKLHDIRPQAVLLPILLLHSFRHLGLMFLAPGIGSQRSWRCSQVQRSSRGIGVPGFSYGCSMWKERRISWRPSRWPQCMPRRHTWDRSIGFPRSGSRHLVTHYITFLILGRHWTRARYPH